MKKRSLIQFFAVCMLFCSVCISCKDTRTDDWDHSLAGTISFINGYPILEAESSFDGVPLVGLQHSYCSFYKYSDTAVSLRCSIGWEEIRFVIEIPYIPLSGEFNDIAFNYVSTDSVVRSKDAETVTWDDAIKYTPENTVVRGWVKIDMLTLAPPPPTVRSASRPSCTCEINITTWLDGKELNIKITSIGW